MTGPPITPGARFGLLIVLRQLPAEGRGRYVDAKCDCGRMTAVRVSRLFSGETTSCGCARAAARKRATLTHGLRRHPLYTVWASMKARCYRPKHISYPNYGGRGIRVCDRWRDSFENFYADMGPTYQPGLEIDRHPDNDGDYEPGNCRWTTRFENNKNRRVRAACRLGHPLSGKNLFINSRGNRRCRECWNAWKRQRRRDKETP